MCRDKFELSLAVGRIGSLIDCTRTAFENDTSGIPMDRRGIASTLETASIEAEKLVEAIERAELATPSNSGSGPIQELFQRHQTLGDEAAEFVLPSGITGEQDNELMEALFWKKRDRLAEDIMALPCRTAADFAAKAIVDSNRGDFGTDWDTSEFWREARGLTGLPEPQRKTLDSVNRS